MRELVTLPEVVATANRWKFDPACSYEYIYDDRAFNRLVVTDLAEHWNDFLKWSEGLQGWCFRGQRESKWTLQSSLEREIRVSASFENISGHRHADRRSIEETLLCGFRNLAPRHLRRLPQDEDLASWFALMQHYGGPTRLLDWTECPFVGLYFAAREVGGQGNRSALWAVDLDWLEHKTGLGPLSSLDGPARLSYLNKLMVQSEKPLVVRVDPPYTNDRMVAQKGFFLWKLYRDVPLFDPMLMNMMLHPEVVHAPVVRKLEFGPELRAEFIERLLRERGICESQLFPGNDFCEPLRLELRAMVGRAKAEYEEELRSVQRNEVGSG